MAQCTAKAKGSGAQCRRDAVTGASVCAVHGGSAGQVKRKAQERVALATAEREAARIGITRRDIHPAEALIELVQYTAGEVDYWRHVVSQVDDTDLVWGRTQHRDGLGPEGPVDVTTSEAKPHIAYVMLERSSDRLATYAAAALKAGCDERRVRIAEQQGAIFVGAQREILARMLDAMLQLLRDLGVADSEIVTALERRWAESMNAIVPAVLRSLAAQEAPPA